MSFNMTEREELLEKVTLRIRQISPADQSDLAAAFAKKYYGNIAYEDLYEHTIENLAGAAFSHWSLIYQRAPGEARVRVYNPSFEADGWQSAHTIVEISHDDMPFLVDSTRMEIIRRGIGIFFAIHTGGIRVQRDAQNRISKLFVPENSNEPFSIEAPIQFKINKILDKAFLVELETSILRVLSDVSHIVTDWQPMLAKLNESLRNLELNPPALDKAEIAESKAFLSWLMDDHFIFLGCRDYELVEDQGKSALKILPDSGLGVYRDKTTSKEYRAISDMTSEAQELLLSPQVLIIAKTNTHSTVHRNVYTDYIGVKQFNSQGKLIGERRFIGLYTSAAYHDNPRTIPFVRHKVTQVLSHSGYPVGSHADKALKSIMEGLPRDDLFQATVGELNYLSHGILTLQERNVVRLFARRDVYGRYISCLVFLPRERYDTALETKIRHILEDAFQGYETTANTLFTDSVLARIHYVVRLKSKTYKSYDLKKIEQSITNAVRSWLDDLLALLTEVYGNEAGTKLFTCYQQAFPAGYIEHYPPAIAVADIKHIERLSPEYELELGLYQRNDNLHFKIFKTGEPILLSMVMPILENMGLCVIDEQPYTITRSDGSIVWAHDFDMKLVQQDESIKDLSAIKNIFKTSFRKTWTGLAENDGFNRLILMAHLNWREAALLRALAKYARQITFKLSQSYIENTLSRHPHITKQLIDLFNTRFDPDFIDDRNKAAKALEKKLLLAIDKVTNLDEDKIFRFYIALIKSILRTNYFQINKEGELKNYLSFKFSPDKIPDVPLPLPKYEIFVYSPDFEAVHLRGAKVARGGLRWSDRPEDFRTEVLGLMKAQHVKNAVIVPAGAKGGFYPKKLPQTTERHLIINEAIKCYQNFIRGMLDITDNLENGIIITPPNVIRYDDDDHYLVVAADKGTATFSDIANAITLEYNFWLGDAFASGGSQGYDHKKMAITARGAWESVKRHFRHLKIDIQQQDFTVVGIGDMSGDVFGNGMLLSEHICLIGAFNHQHIFIDPYPDAKASFTERQRLFNLPRSSWADYDSKLISKGGGIFERNAKSIPVSPEMQAVFDLTSDQIEPNNLIRAMLQARVDLLWNGGIGTYVKASQENNFQIGDKSNDGLRINATELRCKVVGEGGNLGFTQLSRIEYASRGGYIYTDFIDNSAGVDCSDHEVNLKILLNTIVAQQKLTEVERNTLLSSLTNEIAELVLLDNYRQTQAIDLITLRINLLFDIYQRYINEVSEKGILNRELEFLPDNKTLSERKVSGIGLTRPEIAILFAYGKIHLKQVLLQSDIPEDAYLANSLQAAFPATVNQKFADELQNHSLRREIIVTQISNTLINEMGFIFVYRLIEETGANTADIVRAYVAARDIFGLDRIWRSLEFLDNKIDSEEQLSMMLVMTQLVRRETRWILNNYRHHLVVADIVKKFAHDVQYLFDELPNLLTGERKADLDKQTAAYLEAKVPLPIATKVASASAMFAALDIVNAAHQHKLSITKVAQYYFLVGNELNLTWMRTQVNLQKFDDQWSMLGLAALRDQLDTLQGHLAINILHYPVEAADPIEHIKAWSKHYKKIVDRWQVTIDALRKSKEVNLVMLFVAVKELANLMNSSENKVLGK